MFTGWFHKRERGNIMKKDNNSRDSLASSAATDFRKSSFCDGGACVEVALRADGKVFVRDGKKEIKKMLEFTAGEWAAFVKGVKLGEFDVE